MLEWKEVSDREDGCCDSPGHCAKYCSYSIMDVENNKILENCEIYCEIYYVLIKLILLKNI